MKNIITEELFRLGVDLAKCSGLAAQINPEDTHSKELNDLRREIEAAGDRMTDLQRKHIKKTGRRYVMPIRFK